MKRLLTILLAALAAAACIKDPTAGEFVPPHPDASSTIAFGHHSFDDIRIDTRSEMTPLSESRVTDIYVMVFDNGGDKIYGHYFNYANRIDNSAELEMDDFNRWWVNNIDPTKGEAGTGTGNTTNVRYTYGELRIKCPDVTNGTIYMIANFDPDLMNISHEKLELVSNEEELKNLITEFNQQTTFRTGNFMMVGWTSISVINDSVTVGSGDDQTSRYDGTYESTKNSGDGHTSVKRIMLDRLDAKVSVKVGIVPGAPTKKDAADAAGNPIYVYQKDENGDYLLDADGNRIPEYEADGVTRKIAQSVQTVESFSPTSWQVMNIPEGAFLIPRSDNGKTDDYDASNAANAEIRTGFFNGEEYDFEVQEIEEDCAHYDADGNYVTTDGTDRTLHGFTFYMLENRQRMKKTVGSNFHLRDKRIKYNETQTNDETGRSEYVDSEGNVYKNEYGEPITTEDYDKGEYIYTVDENGDIWEYAPQYGTYVILRGEVTMRVEEENSLGAQTLNALVTYYIHLGNFGRNKPDGSYEDNNDNGDTASLDNYAIRRNTHYTYTINICGVDKIEVEVAEDVKSGWDETNEQQSAAVGDVYIAQESIYTFDAHYGQRVFRFNAEAIKKSAEADMLTWYVATPFGRDGIPDRMGPDQVEVPTNLDYEWVHFMLNDSKGTISVKNVNDPKQNAMGRYYEFDNFTAAANGTATGSVTGKKLNGTGSALEDVTLSFGSRAYSETTVDGKLRPVYFQYTQKNTAYPGDSRKSAPYIDERTGMPVLMNVMELCNLLREQVKLYDEDQKNRDWTTESGYKAGYTKQSIFDEPLRGDDGRRLTSTIIKDNEAYSVPIYEGGNIYITAFVDEFYYEHDPTTGNVSPTLWHDFVHKPGNEMRMMHILCDASVSVDGDSSATGSVVTIRQRPIQTIYNIATATEGWGVETVDETMDVLNFFSPAEERGTHYKYGEGKFPSVPPADCDNTSVNNGLYNTICMWGMTTGTIYWADYLDYTHGNDYTSKLGGEASEDVKINFLKEDKAAMIYTCMQRNRDNDGNGVIDNTEVHWYLASSGQLVDLFLGDQGLTKQARLFYIPDSYGSSTTTKDHYSIQNIDVRRIHVVASDRSSFYEGRNDYRLEQNMIWAEEGLSTGPYNVEWGSLGRYQVRCVRNLGRTTEPTDKNDYPESPFKSTLVSSAAGADARYLIDANRLNSGSRRASTPWDLVPMSEMDYLALLPETFVTGPYATVDPNDPDSGYLSFQTNKANFESYIMEPLNDGRAVCPDGYRVPNIRELGAMKTYITDDAWWGDYWLTVNTYHSLGPTVLSDAEALNNKQVTWVMKPSYTTMSKDNSARIRCVRDTTIVR